MQAVNVMVEVAQMVVVDDLTDADLLVAVVSARRGLDEVQELVSLSRHHSTISSLDD